MARCGIWHCPRKYVLLSVPLCLRLQNSGLVCVFLRANAMMKKKFCADVASGLPRCCFKRQSTILTNPFGSYSSMFNHLSHHKSCVVEGTESSGGRIWIHCPTVQSAQSREVTVSDFNSIYGHDVPVPVLYDL